MTGHRGSSARIVGEQQLAFYQGSNKTVIHHGLYLLNNAICLCEFIHIVAVMCAWKTLLGTYSLCKEAGYKIRPPNISVCLIVLNSQYPRSFLCKMSVIS